VLLLLSANKICYVILYDVVCNMRLHICKVSLTCGLVCVFRVLLPIDMGCRFTVLRRRAGGSAAIYWKNSNVLSRKLYYYNLRKIHSFVFVLLLFNNMWYFTKLFESFPSPPQCSPCFRMCVLYLIFVHLSFLYMFVSNGNVRGEMIN
jgi:hypothetical protein